jgi:hypothetical protein
MHLYFPGTLTQYVRQGKYFLAKKIVTLRIEYVPLKHIACKLKCYTQIAALREKWLAVALASRAHVFVIKVTLQTAERASDGLAKSGVPFVTGDVEL